MGGSFLYHQIPTRGQEARITTVSKAAKVLKPDALDQAYEAVERLDWMIKEAGELTQKEASLIDLLSDLVIVLAFGRSKPDGLLEALADLNPDAWPVCKSQLLANAKFDLEDKLKGCSPKAIDIIKAEMSKIFA